MSTPHIAPRPRPVGHGRPGATLVLRADDGDLLPLEPSRWHRPPTGEERRLLASVAAPILDVGCGPGRLLEALGRRGVVALGVDPAPGAVALARQRGCAVLQRSVFEHLPGEGRWASVLLLDGNLGIGGDPIGLLRRCGALVRPGGVIVAEVEPPGTGWRACHARLERDAEVGSWFRWAVVGADAIAELADLAGLFANVIQPSVDGRWFAHISRQPGHAHACA